MNGFRSDIGQLGGRAGEFDELAGQARRIAENLRHAVDSAGPCWGGDDIGRRFADVHQRRAQQALDELAETPERLSEMGAKFAAAASTYERVDAGNADALGAHGPTAGQG